MTSKIPQRMPLTCKEESVLSIFGRHRARFDRFADRSGASRDSKVCPLATLADRLGRLSSCVNMSVSSLSAAAWGKLDGRRRRSRTTSWQKGKFAVTGQRIKRT